MAIQPTRRNDLYFALIRVMLPEEQLTRQELSRRLERLDIPHPLQLIGDAVDKRLLVEDKRVQDPTSGLWAVPVRYGRNLPESCPAPLFYEPLGRRLGQRPYDESRAVPPTRAAARPASVPPFPPLWEAPPPPPHPKATAPVSYFLADKSTPYRAVTVRQLHECIVRAPSQMQAFTEAAALLNGTRYFPALCQVQDAVAVGGLWQPGGGMAAPSHLGALRLQLEPNRGGRDVAQQALLGDEFLRDALLLAYAGPSELELTLVVELSPECPNYAKAVQQHLDYFAQRYATSGLRCIQAEDSRRIDCQVPVWHDPKAYLAEAMR